MKRKRLKSMTKKEAAVVLMRGPKPTPAAIRKMTEDMIRCAALCPGELGTREFTEGYIYGLQCLYEELFLNQGERQLWRTPPAGTC